MNSAHHHMRARAAIGACALALALNACGGDEEDATAESTAGAETTTAQTTTATETTTEEPATTAAEPGQGSAGGNAADRAKEIVACLDGEGYGASESSGDPATGSDYKLVVGGGIFIVHGFADAAAAERNLPKVEQQAVPPSDVDVYDDAVLELRTTSAFDPEDIEASRAAAEACLAG